MNDETLLVEKQDGVAVLTLNRPEVMNSFNFAMLYALKKQIEAIRFDQDIRVIIVTGSGQKAFCAGADLKERAELNEIQVKEFIFTIRNLFTSIEYLNKPVIAAINGVALGGGAELCLACDIRIAAMNASIGLTETRLAIIPGGGGTQRLPRLVGIENAWPILRSGIPISSDQAKEIGLIHEEVEGDLIETAITWVKNILSGKVPISPIKKDPIPIPSKLPEVDIGHLSRKIDSLLQKAILDGAKMTLDEGLKFESKVSGECLLTEDMRIGMDNFMKNGPRVNAPFVHK